MTDGVNVTRDKMNDNAKKFLAALDRSYKAEKNPSPEEKGYCCNCHIPDVLHFNLVRNSDRMRLFHPAAKILFLLVGNSIEPHEFAVAMAKYLGDREPCTPGGERGSSRWMLKILDSTCVQRKMIVQILELL